MEEASVGRGQRTVSESVCDLLAPRGAFVNSVRLRSRLFDRVVVSAGQKWKWRERERERERKRALGPHSLVHCCGVDTVFSLRFSRGFRVRQVKRGAVTEGEKASRIDSEGKIRGL